MKKVRSLYKAQMGGGTEQDETYKQLATAVYGAIKRGQSPDDVYQSLITNKINKDVALKIVSGIVEYMVSNGELEQEDLQRQSQEKQQEQQQRMQEQQAFSQPDSITDEWNENSAQGNNYDQEMQDANQQSMDLVNEDAEDTEDLLGFQDGGQNAALEQYDQVDESVEPSEVVDYSKLISSTPGTQNVQFPGIEEYYLPYNPLFSGDFQLNYQEPSSNELEESDQMQYAKYGGSRVKRKFTNQVLKLLKKQAGGEGEPQEDEVVNSGKASQTDDLTGSVKKVKDSFINAVSGQAKKVAVGNWFEKLKQNNDPMLDQILNPPSKENPLERKMQEDKQIQQELSPGQMKKGGSNRAYNRLAKKIYNQMASQIPIPKGFSLPISYYDKRAPFVNQRFSTIGVPQINRYFELLAQMYPKPKSANEQADDAVIKNNMVDTGIDANPLWAQPNNFNLPQNPFMQEGGYIGMPEQYGGATGSNDPSIPALTRFIYGGYDQFPEESKNVNDPYFSDMTPYPQMQDGGDPTEYTHYTHGDDDVFHDQMNELVQAEDGINVNNPYLEQLQQLLQQSNYSPRDIRRAMRDQRRMTGNTYRDLLFPANRAIQYSGSWAQQMGLPFLDSTGQTYLGDVNGPLAKREVTKRGILGRPKEWTDYYMIGADGNNQDIITLGTNNQDNQDNQNTSKKKPIDRLDRKIQRWDKRAARNEEEYQPLEGSITNYENPDDFYNAVNPVSDEDAEFLGAELTPSSEYKNKGKVNKVRDAEGNWYDRNQEMIPDKKTPSEDDAEFFETVTNMYKKEGGILRKALLGDETPISYTGNPVFQGQSEVDWTTNTAGSTNLQPSSFWNNQQSFNAAPPSAPQQMQDQNKELTKYTVDPNQIEEYQAPKQFQGLVGVKRKRKDMTTVDPEAGVNTFNAGVRGALGAIDNMRSRKQEAQMYAKNFDPTQIYGKKERIDKGDWDVNTGMYRTNETGANRLGRSKKYGGYMQDGGESDNMFYPQDNMVYPPGDNQYIMRPVNMDIWDMLYNKYYSDPNFTPYNEDPYIEEVPEDMDIRMVKEGGETYMSDEQINAFLAAGGEIEYL